MDPETCNIFPSSVRTPPTLRCPSVRPLTPAITLTGFQRPLGHHLHALLRHLEGVEMCATVLLRRDLHVMASNASSNATTATTATTTTNIINGSSSSNDDNSSSSKTTTTAAAATSIIVNDSNNNDTSAGSAAATAKSTGGTRTLTSLALQHLQTSVTQIMLQNHQMRSAAHARCAEMMPKARRALLGARNVRVAAETRPHRTTIPTQTGHKHRRETPQPPISTARPAPAQIQMKFPSTNQPTTTNTTTSASPPKTPAAAHYRSSPRLDTQSLPPSTAIANHAVRSLACLDGDKGGVVNPVRRL